MVVFHFLGLWSSSISLERILDSSSKFWLPSVNLLLLFFNFAVLFLLYKATPFLFFQLFSISFSVFLLILSAFLSPFSALSVLFGFFRNISRFLVLYSPCNFLPFSLSISCLLVQFFLLFQDARMNQFWRKKLLSMFLTIRRYSCAIHVLERYLRNFYFNVFIVPWRSNQLILA